MNQFEKNETDLEGGKLLKDGDKATRGNKVVKSQNQALLAGLAYCISSCSMILVNKFVLSSYNFDAGISLMLYQVITLLILFISSGVCICFPPDDIKRGFFFFYTQFYLIKQFQITCQDLTISWYLYGCRT